MDSSRQALQTTNGKSFFFKFQIPIRIIGRKNPKDRDASFFHQNSTMF